MARKQLLTRSLALLAFSLVSSGCVSMTEYSKLQEQFARQEAYVKRNRQTVETSRREATRMRLASHESELNIQKLEEEKKELVHLLQQERTKLETATTTASISKETIAESEPQLAASPASIRLTGFEYNDQSGGIILDQRAMFSPGSSRIKSTGRKILTNLAKKLNSGAFRTMQVRIEGHTDSSPITRSRKTIKDNWQLSGMRARAVLEVLQKQGVASERLSFAGYGFQRPIDDSKANQARNRRVEVVIFD